MPRRKVSKEFIVHQALKNFKQKSFYNTTMSDIASACGLLKGSIYHHFTSKEDLVKAVLAYVHQYFREEVFIHAYNQEIDVETRMKTMVERAESKFLDQKGGCFMGNLGLETAHVNPEFSEIIRKFFRDYILALKTIYQERYPEDKATELAEQGIAELEGALMLSRIFNKKDILQKAHKRIVLRLATIQTTVW